MPMPRRRARRTLALLALAFTLFAALPCAALAGDSCCGPAAACGDASESPCAQLAAAPCCQADGAPLAISATVAVQDAPSQCVARSDVFRAPPPALASYSSRLACADIAHRSAILRL
jgi:hypothetical protein